MGQKLTARFLLQRIVMASLRKRLNFASRNKAAKLIKEGRKKLESPQWKQMEPTAARSVGKRFNRKVKAKFKLKSGR